MLTDFVTQLLRVCMYRPSLQLRMLDIIIVRCLEIDVEIVIEETGSVRILEGPKKEDVELDEQEETYSYSQVIMPSYNKFTY